MMRLFSVIVLGVLLGGCAHVPPAQSDCPAAGYVYLIDVNRIVATTQCFLGEAVIVQGVLSTDFEDTRLYADSSMYQYGIASASLWIELPRDHEYHHLDGQWVLIRGQVDLITTDGVLPQAVIKGITRVELLRDREFYRQQAAPQNQ